MAGSVVHLRKSRNMEILMWCWRCFGSKDASCVAGEGWPQGRSYVVLTKIVERRDRVAPVEEERESKMTGTNCFPAMEEARTALHSGRRDCDTKACVRLKPQMINVLHFIRRRLETL